MREGSIVVLLPRGILSLSRRELQKYIDWLPTFDEKTEYMLSRVGDSIEGNTLVFLEKPIGFIKNHPDFPGMTHEIGIRIEYVRELLPPEEVDLEMILTHANKKEFSIT